jgi:hypothetical protein
MLRQVGAKDDMDAVRPGIGTEVAPDIALCHPGPVRRFADNDHIVQLICTAHCLQALCNVQVK